MVSAGISGGITPVKTVAPSVAPGIRTEEVSFGEFMMQSMTEQGGMEADNDFSNLNHQVKVSEIPQTSNAVENKVSSKMNQKEQVKEQPESKKIDEKLNEKVEDAVEDIKDKIKEEFDVTDEDIEKALETLGLTMSDLLNQKNLADFVVELTGLESSIDLLVSSEISMAFNELLDFIEQTVADITEEFAISVDELTTLIDEMALAQNLEEGNAFEFVSDNVEAVEEQIPNVSDEKSDNLVKDTLTENDTEKQVVKSPVESNNTESKLGTASDEKQMDMSGQSTTETMPDEIVSNFTNAVNEAFAANGLSEAVDSVQVVNQIIENAKIILNEQITSMEFMLNPENLGKVNLNISVREGIVTASIVAQNEAVKEAIESQIVVLKESLNNQGLKVEAVEVTVESHAFEAGTGQSKSEGFDKQKEEAQKKSGSRPLRLDSLEELMAEELTDEEKIILDMMEDEGNQINFKA